LQRFSPTIVSSHQLFKEGQAMNTRLRSSRSHLLAALLLPAFVLVGCPPADPPPEPSPDVEPLPPQVEEVEPPMIEEHHVTVTLVDFEVQMPATLSRGLTTFTVVNAGTVEHSFAFEGEGLHAEIEASLNPGEQATLTGDLQPGSYRAYCPVGDHAEQGMELEVEVVDDEPMAG
jgi:hypothetical protein